MRAVNLEKLLPADIPPGERVLWFGRPEPTSLWRRAYRADWVALWFGGMTIWNFTTINQSEGLREAIVSALRTLGFGAAALAILGLLALLAARTTLYVLTERRLIIKNGIALPIFINLPYLQIANANVRVFGDGTGEVTLGIVKGERVPYLAIWPSARPMRFTSPEPTLRCIANPREIAHTLAQALVQASGQPGAAVRSTESRGEPGRVATATA